MSQNQAAVKTAQSAANAEKIPAALDAALEATKTARAAFDTAKATGDKQASDKARDGLDAAAMTNLEAVIADLEALTEFYRVTEDIETDLTPEERRKLISARVRNNGFIDKAFDLALANQQYLPSYITPNQVLAAMRRFEDARQIMILGSQFLRIATDRFMLEANRAYHLALLFYRSLREQARANISGAKDLFDELLNYFKHRRKAGDKPTEHQLDEDFHRLEHGTAEGEMVVRSELPHTTGGQHEVVDTIRSGHSDVKGNVDESVED